MQPIIDHIQITVKNMDQAVPFYDKLLPILGFDAKRRVEATIEGHELQVLDYTHPLLSFCISSPRSVFAKDVIHRRKPGSLHHLAFKASSLAEVDRVHEQLLGIGAEIVSAPRLYPEYSAQYYAVFFKDLEGIKYEVVFDPPRDE